MLVSLFFGALCYLALHTLPRPRNAPALEPLLQETPARDPGGATVSPVS
jgi:hypothetical protein